MHCALNNGNNNEHWTIKGESFPKYSLKSLKDREKIYGSYIRPFTDRYFAEKKN